MRFEGLLLEYGGPLCCYILLLIFGSFIVVLSKVHPYSSTGLSLHARSVNTCAEWERFRYKLQCAGLTDCGQYYNHRV